MKINAAASVAGAPLTHEGAPAKRIGAEAELRRSVMACMLWEDTFYESGVDIANRIGNLIPYVDPAVVTQIALEARGAMKLRHAPLWLARNMASGAPEYRRAVAGLLPLIIQRPDELTEFLAIYWKDARQPLSAAVKRGLAEAFKKFDAYSLAKYNRDEAVKLRDVLFLTHAKPKDEEQALVWKQLVDGTLPTPDTWEVAISAAKGNKEATLAEWNRLLAGNKLGALALLRNLRNMQEAGVSTGTLALALDAMKVDRVLPFRFVSAAQAVGQLEPALERAMFRCTEAMPKLRGTTALLVDVSGSMVGANVSAKSNVDRLDAAASLAMLVREVCESPHIIAFSDTPTMLPLRRGFALRDCFRRLDSNGTYTEKAKTYADMLPYNRIIIITDEQSHERISNPKGKGYVVNVGTYKNGIGYGAWTHIDGWSEAILEYIRLAEGV